MPEPADLAVHTAAANAEVQRRRSDLSWVDDPALRNLEESNPAAAWLLSVLFGGGGQLYNGDTRRGLALIGGWLGLILLANVAGVFTYAALAVMVGGSIHATRQSLAINRYLGARAEQQRMLAAGGSMPGNRLAASMLASPDVAHAAPAAPAAPAALASPDSPDHGLVASAKSRLEKLAVLRAGGVIDEAEHRERRIEILAELGEHAELVHQRIEEVLFELLPLIQSGGLTREDVDFLKSMGGRR
jgi:TM2 domain-containing membrane protein YozV